MTIPKSRESNISQPIRIIFPPQIRTKNGSILTGGEIPAGVRDALFGVEHGEQLEGIRGPRY